MNTEVETIYHFELDLEDLTTIFNEAQTCTFDFFDVCNEKWELYGTNESRLTAFINLTNQKEIDALFPEKEMMRELAKTLQDRICTNHFSDCFFEICRFDLNIF